MKLKKGDKVWVFLSLAYVFKGVIKKVDEYYSGKPYKFTFVTVALTDDSLREYRVNSSKVFKRPEEIEKLISVLEKTKKDIDIELDFIKDERRKIKC